MVEIRAVYEGGLHCRVTHGPSGQEFRTDAPLDNGGEGRMFSPTDLVAAALGSCILTVMGIVATRHQIPLEGATARVVKEMVSSPSRRIGRLAVTVTFPRSYPDPQRTLLESAAKTCPVHHSLHPETDVPITFAYPA